VSLIGGADMKEVKTLETLEILETGVAPVTLYNQMVDRDVDQRMEIKFKGGEISFVNDGSNYSRRVFKDSLSRARLLSN